MLACPGHVLRNRLRKVPVQPSLVVMTFLLSRPCASPREETRRPRPANPIALVPLPMPKGDDDIQNIVPGRARRGRARSKAGNLEDKSSKAEDTSQTSAREGGGLAGAGSDGALGRGRGSAGGDNRGSGCVLGGPGGLGASRASRAARIGVSTCFRVQISVREHTRCGR
jgi:hypothetical protein